MRMHASSVISQSSTHVSNPFGTTDERCAPLASILSPDGRYCPPPRLLAATRLGSSSTDRHWDPPTWASPARLAQTEPAWLKCTLGPELDIICEPWLKGLGSGTVLSFRRIPLAQAGAADMSPNIVLHHAIPTRSCRVAWLLEELEVPYKLRPVDFPKELWTDEYKKQNPNGM